jgi:DNA-directed RNA polymerase subunit RPC12/RpoP
MTAPKCLQTIHEAGMDALVECLGCGRQVQCDPLALYSRLPGKWLKNLDSQGKQLRCSGCGHRGARITAVPRISEAG